MADYKLTTKKSWSATLNDLEFELEKWGAIGVAVNYPRGARLEGFNQSIEERRVILRYTKNNQETILTMDKQKRAVDNLRVLYICIESMRMNERRGIGEIMQQAYAQLSAPVHIKNPFEVLGIFQDSPIEVCEAVYRAMAAKYHPDAKPSGNAGKFKELNQAIEAIRIQYGK